MLNLGQNQRISVLRAAWLQLKTYWPLWSITFENQTWEHVLETDILDISCVINISFSQQEFINYKSTLVQVMASYNLENSV